MRIDRCISKILLPLVPLLLWGVVAAGVVPEAKMAAARIAPATFPLTINGRALHYAINFEPVMPGQEVVFATAAHLAPRLAVQVDGRNLRVNEGRAIWRAPQTSGVHKVDVHLRSEAAVT